VIPLALDGYVSLIMLREDTPPLGAITAILVGALSIRLIYP
jgi:uncharacterized membrane protein